MFGFMNGGCDPTYRRIYALCCQNQFARHGRLSTLFHSYESVFLACLACDLGWMKPPRPEAPRCCRLLKRASKGRLDVDAVPEEIGAFLAAFAMLLTWIKLQDDIRDSKSLFAGSAKFLYRRQFRKAFEVLAKIDPDFESRLTSILESHAILERPGTQSVEEYCQPTADGFQYLFELLTKTQSLDETTEQSLATLGANLGRAIISFDCAVDWKQDRRKGEFNPLRDADDVAASLQLCKRALVNMGWALDRELRATPTEGGSPSIALRVIRLRFDRVASLRAANLAPQHLSSPALRPQRLAFRKGDCDCCCPLDACGEECCSLDCCSLDCDAGDCDLNKCDGVADCCGDGCSFCPCEACSPACDVCESRNSKKNSTNAAKANPETDGTNKKNLKGKRGIAVGPLNPQGVVAIEGQEHPASAQTGWIDDGREVEVVDEQDFGLLVRTVDS